MRRRAAIAASAVGLVAIAVVAVFATVVARPPSTAKSPLLGKRAPSVAGANLLTGSPVSLDALHGKYVLVSFFASWCIPCQAELPELESFAFNERSRARVLGVAFDDTNSDAATFLRHYGATWPAVGDPSSGTAVAYGVAAPPQSFLVSPSGRVVAWFPGAVTSSVLTKELGVVERDG
jgi:cytochrome c biogenesis protein CcmG, thiol:disulfide interchange protein DsbE